MKNQIISSNYLVADHAIASSIATVPIGSAGTGNTPFTFNLPAGKRAFWRLSALFTLGATGGFRLRANNSQSSAAGGYNAQFVVEENTTPATLRNNQTAEADFANASAVAATYALKAYGSVTQGAVDGTVSLEFAQNTSDVLPITMLEGAQFEVWIY